MHQILTTDQVGPLRRIDLYAVTQPKRTRRALIVFVLLWIYAVVAGLAAARNDRWNDFIAFAAGFVFVSVLLIIVLRAIKRVPITKAWLDQLSRGR